ncbi:MAG: cardiolipin synthase [Eubacteriales bacterium]|nr:cardiolipin synthase [Eubacteriales bacterium]
MSTAKQEPRPTVLIAADGFATAGGKNHSRSRLRLLVVTTAVLAQLVLIWLVVINLRDHFTTLYVILEFLALIQVLYLVSKNESSAYTFAWTVIILLLPVFGEALYLLWGRSGQSSRSGRRVRKIFSHRPHWLKSNPDNLSRLSQSFPLRRRLVNYLENQGFPVYEGTDCTYYPLGELQFADLRRDLESAERFIFLEYFIVAAGQVWDEIHAILRQKAASGVEVRLLYDDAGSMATLPDRFRETLAAENIQAIAYSEVQKGLVHLYLNHRNHQKIAVIDGQIGYTGGTNLADEYANLYPRFGHWKDTAVRLEGDAVWSLTVIFLEMWQSQAHKSEDYHRYHPVAPAIGTGFFQPFSDGPVNNPVNPAEQVYRQIIASAHDYVYITTPYLVIDEFMMDALCQAAQGGIDVRIATPRIWDKWYVHKVTRSNYHRLVAAGVKVFEYLPGFLHAKTILSDDDLCVTGTINMDYRSFHLQFEDGVLICGAPVLVAIKEDLLAIFSISEPVTLSQLKHVRLPERLLQAFLRLFAPLF